VDVSICVGGYDEELFAIGEEVGCHRLDVCGGFREEAELVGVLLFGCLSVLVLLYLS